MKLTKAQRQQLFDQFDGRCGYCGERLPDRWHADHKEPIFRVHDYKVIDGMLKAKATGEIERPDRDNFENMVASCPSCNLYKKGYGVEGFRRMLERGPESLEAYTAYRFAKRYGLVKETEGKKVVFHFEKGTLWFPKPPEPPA